MTLRRCIALIHIASLLLLPNTSTSFNLLSDHRHARVALFQLRGGETAMAEQDSAAPEPISTEDPFPVISRFVGGTWVNTYNIFNGIEFERGDDRIRYVSWEVDGKSCKVLLRTDETADPIVLQGESIGNGVVRFDAQGLPFEYLFHQIGTDTILVSRTEHSACEECGQPDDASPSDANTSIRLDCGSMVLTDENSCVQTIVHMEDGKLNMMEVIRGVRKDP